MLALTIEAEGLVHGLQGSDSIVFGHHAADADFAGGDHLDVDPSFRQSPEHLCGTARC